MKSACAVCLLSVLISAGSLAGAETAPGQWSRLSGVWSGEQSRTPTGDCPAPDRKARQDTVRINFKVTDTGDVTGTILTTRKPKPTDTVLFGTISGEGTFDLMERMIPVCDGVKTPGMFETRGRLVQAAEGETIELEMTETPCPARGCSIAVKMVLRREPERD